MMTSSDRDHRTTISFSRFAGLSQTYFEQPLRISVHSATVPDVGDHPAATMLSQSTTFTHATNVVVAPAVTHNQHHTTKYKRCFCSAPRCSRIVKCQGVCQRHGAVATKCRVSDCNRQAQGNFNKMCSMSCLCCAALLCLGVGSIHFALTIHFVLFQNFTSAHGRTSANPAIPPALRTNPRCRSLLKTYSHQIV